jgi:UDPglucose 6-dehydrogenase
MERSDERESLWGHPRYIVEGAMQKRPLEVAVIGLWHLGSVAAACLTKLGHRVVGVDDDSNRVTALAHSHAPIYEPKLDDLLAEGVAARRLRFTTEVVDAVAEADAVVVTHDTSVTDQDEADISAILRTVEQVTPLLRRNCLVAVMSQVPVGTSAIIRQKVKRAKPHDSSEVVYIPENLRLGQAVDSFLFPDLMVVGAEDTYGHEAAEALFAGIESKWVRTNLATAEMVKHAINAFLATSISFGNEIANLCQSVGADATQVASILHLDRRVGPHVPIDPGMGFAGGTLARDVRALQGLGARNTYQPRLLDAVLMVNEEQNSLPLRWLIQIYGTLSGLRIGLLGLTYKPGTSTLRRSAAIDLIRKLVAEHAVVAASDPKADLSELADLPRFQFSRDPYAAALNADALLLITPWPEFRALDYEKIHARMRHPILLDMPNALDKERLERFGFVYLGVGRGVPKPLERF